MDTDTDSIFGNIVPFPGDDMLLGNDDDVDMFLSSSSLVSLPKQSTTTVPNLSSSSAFLSSSSSASTSSIVTASATAISHSTNGANLPLQLRCEICTGTVWNNLDPILVCITCGIKVHRGCYGSGGRITTGIRRNNNKNGEFFQCQLCLGDTIRYQQQRATLSSTNVSFLSSSSLSSASSSLASQPTEFTPPVRTCVICSHSYGAMKPVVEGGYAHIACATWLPELVVDNAINMISNIGNIAKDRATLQCSVCHKTGGCFQCGHGKCGESYHGNCVLEAVLSGIAYAAPIPLHGGWQWKVYCSKHSKEARNNYAIVINQYLRGVDQAQTKISNRSTINVLTKGNGEQSLQINRDPEDDNDSENDDDDEEDDNESKADTATDAGKKVTKPRSTKLFVRSYFPRSFNNIPVRGPTSRNGAWNDTTGSVETTLTISEDDKITDPAAQYELQEKFWTLVVDPHFVPLEIHDVNCLAFLIDRAGNPTSSSPTVTTTAPITASSSSSLSSASKGSIGKSDAVNALNRSGTTLSSSLSASTIGNPPVPSSIVDIDVSVNSPPNIQRSGASLVRDSSLVHSMDDDATNAADSISISVGIHHGSFRAAMDFDVSLTNSTIALSNITADDIDVQLNDWNPLNWQDDTAVIMAKTLNIAYGKLGRPTLMAKTMATDEDPIHEILGSRIEFLDIYDDISTNIAALQAALREEQRATAVRTLQLASRVQASGNAQELMQKVGLVFDDSLMELLIGRRTIQNTFSSYLPFPISPPNGVECLPWQHAIPPSVGRRLYSLPETVVPPIPASTVARQPPRSNIPEIIFTKLFEAACDAATWKVVTRHLERGIRDHSEEDLIRSKRAIPASWLIKAEGRPTMEQLQKDGVDHSPGICAVCWDLHSSPEDDTTLSCERCHIYLHRRCYGIVNDPALTEDEVPFLCDPCAVAEQNILRNADAIGKVSKKAKLINKPTAPLETCYLCNLSGGAFKRTIQGTWVHILCALWSPYAKIVNVQKMGPIDLYSQELLEFEEPNNSSSIMINPIAESLSNYRRLIDAASGSLVDGGYDKFVASLTNVFDTVTLAQNRQQVFKTLTRELSVIHLANPVIYNAQKEGLLLPSVEGTPKRFHSENETVIDSPLDFSHIFSKPQTAACHLCSQKNGLLIRCSVQSCNHVMHPMCAWREGLQLSITIPGSKTDKELLGKLNSIASSLTKECTVPVSTTLSSTSNLLLVPVCSFIYCGGRKGLRYVSFCKSHGMEHNCENQKQLRKSMFSEVLANPLDDETFFEWRNARGVGRRITLNRGRRKSRDENEEEGGDTGTAAAQDTHESKSAPKYPSTSQKDTGSNSTNNRPKSIKLLTLTLPVPVIAPPAPPRIEEPVLPIRIKLFPDGTAQIKDRYEAWEYDKNKK